MKAELLDVCERLLNAGLNGLYQGVLLTVVVACGLRLLSRSNAATRHAAWFTTLLLLVSVFPAHYYLDQAKAPSARGLTALAGGVLAGQAAHQVPTRADRAGQLDAPSAEVPAGSSAWHELGEVWPLGESPGFSTTSEAELAEASRTGVEHKIGGNSGVPGRGRGSTERVGSIASAPGLSAHHGWSIGQFLSPVSWNLLSRSGLPTQTSAVLVGAWLVLALLRMGFLCARLRQVRMLKRTSFPVTAELDRRFQALCASLGVKRGVQVRTSFQQRTAILLGFFHPVVLLPDSGPEPRDSQETEHVLRHELAHLRRRDDWTNLVQNFIQAAIFFHPAVWWVCRRLSLEREIACDDCVLQQGGGPRTYALTLANIAGRLSRSAPRLAPGVSTSKSQLQQRISMILNMRRDTSSCLAKTRLGVITSAAALFAALAIYSGPRLVLAQSATTPPAAGLPPAPVGPAIGNSDRVSPAPPAATAAPVAPALPANDPLTPSAPEVEPGPKPKSDNAEEGPKAPHDAPRIWSPTPKEVPPKPPGHPLMPAGPHGSIDLYAARSLDSGSADSSVEARLDRLERMVKSLMTGQDSNRFGRDLRSKIDEQNKPEKNLDEVRRLAREGAARAREDAKRAAEDLKRAAKEAEHLDAERGKRALVESREAAAKQIEALRRAKENLSREMERLDRQIKQLEEQRQRLQERSQSGNQNEDERGRTLLLGEYQKEYDLLHLLQEQNKEQSAGIGLPVR